MNEVGKDLSLLWEGIERCCGVLGQYLVNKCNHEFSEKVWTHKGHLVPPIEPVFWFIHNTTLYQRDTLFYVLIYLKNVISKMYYCG